MYKVHAYCFQKKKAHAYHAHFGKLKTRTLIARTLMTRTHAQDTHVHDAHDYDAHAHDAYAYWFCLCKRFLREIFVYLCNRRFTNALTTMKRNPKNWGESFEIEIWSNSLPKAYSASDNETLCGPCKAAFIMLKYKFEGFKVPNLFC